MKRQSIYHGTSGQNSNANTQNGASFRENGEKEKWSLGNMLCLLICSSLKGKHTTLLMNVGVFSQKEQFARIYKGKVEKNVYRSIVPLSQQFQVEKKFYC